MKESKKIINERLKQINIQIGNNILEARVAEGVNAEWLGEAAGVTQQQIFKYESGKNMIPPGRLVIIAESLKTDISFFFKGVLDNPDPQKIDIRKRLCADTSRHFIKIKDINQQKAIFKEIKKLVDYRNS